MKLIKNTILACCLLLGTFSSYAQEVIKEKESNVPTAEEMKDYAKQTEAGFEALANLVDKLDFSFLKDLDPNLKDEDVQLSDEEKAEIKSKIMDGSKAIQRMNFVQIEEALLKIEKALNDLDPDNFFYDDEKESKKN